MRSVAPNNDNRKSERLTGAIFEDKSEVFMEEREEWDIVCIYTSDLSLQRS